MGTLFPHDDTEPTRSAVGRSAMRAVHAVTSVDGAVPPARHGRDPVVVVGGYATTEPQLTPLRRWLASLGYDVSTFTTGYGVGCSTTAATALAGRIRHVAATSDTPVHVVGHSRGGQFARVAMQQLAADGDVDLGGLITLGTPFAVRIRDVGIYTLAYATGLLGSLGVPGLVTLACMHGRCCDAFRDSMAAPWPADVPFTSVHGVTDALVPPPACHEPAARTVAVDTGHLGLLHHPDALITTADTLAAHTARRVTEPCPAARVRRLPGASWTGVRGRPTRRRPGPVPRGLGAGSTVVDSR